MASSPKVSIIILNWNGKKWLAQFLPSVAATTYLNHEIILVDNGSTDDSIAFTKSNFPQVRIIALDKNYGFTVGNNLALPHIDTPYYVLLNSDVEVSPNWLEPLVEKMESDEKIAAIQPKIRMFAQKTHFEYAGAAGGYLDKFAYPFCRGRVFDTLEEDKGQYEDAREIFWATGACCMVRKKVSDEIGLFEPSFFAHMEEIDFCWRAKNRGYTVFCEPKSVVYHVGGGTLPQGNPRKTFLNIHNSLAMMYRNLPAMQVFPKIFVRLVLDGIFALKLLTAGEMSSIFAIAKAHWTFFLGIPKWHKSRKAMYEGSFSPKLPVSGYLDKSVVWEYFAKGKKQFSDLGIK
jgi:GT2 family glycosyltransferase